MMRRIVPPQYFNHPATVQLFDTLQRLIEDTIVAEKDILLADASGVGSSTDLSLYAKDFDAMPDKEAIRAKMRSYGIVNIPLIKEICRSYKHGEAEVTEDKTGFVLTVLFNAQRGVPENYDQLVKQLRAVIPAHYRIEIELKYRTWRELLDYKWSDLLSMTWREVLNG